MKISSFAVLIHEVTEVLDGTCETVSGRHVDVVADSKIPAGQDLALKFGRVKAA